MELNVCVFFILFIVVSSGAANVVVVLNDEGNKNVKAVDQNKVDNWMRKFYDKCGETEVVGAEKSTNLCDSGFGVGPYCGKEIVKRCVGDREGCIKAKNCIFAIAITETASYFYNDTTTTTPAPTIGTFDKYSRKIESHNVKVLDTCHFDSLPNDGKDLPQKFVGVGLGVFNASSETLNCDQDPSFDNFRAYFFVSDLAACDIQLNRPLYPYLEANTSSIPNPINEFTVLNPEWKSRCSDIKQRIPTGAKPVSKNSDFMKYLLVHYYGTPDYTKFHDFTYSDAANFYESKNNIYIAPAKRNSPSSSSIFNASVFISITTPLFLTLLKQ